MNDTAELSSLLTSTIHISELIKVKEWHEDPSHVRNVIEKFDYITDHYDKFPVAQKSKILIVITNITSQTLLRYIPSSIFTNNLLLVKLTISILKCISHCLKSYPDDSNSLDTIVGHHEKLWKILVVIIGIIDQLRKHQSHDVNTTNSDEELLFELCFNCFTEIVVLYKYNKVNHGGILPQDYNRTNKTLEKLKGPYLAQIVQSCLEYGKHISKPISEAALQCLLAVLERVDQPKDWRTFLPGIFSSLYNICTSGYKKYVATSFIHQHLRFFNCHHFLL